MATQKQRRKRAKEKRHEYELVEIDGDGNETVLSASDLKDEPSVKAPAKKNRSQGTAGGRSARGTPQPPTWGRVLKRAAIFAPIFLATVLLLGGDNMEFAGAIVQTIFLLAVFVPFSYFMDRLVWRSHEKRLARQNSGG